MPSEQQAQRIAEARQQEEVRRRQHQETVTALVDRVHKAREAIEQNVGELHTACSELRTVVRRNYDDSSSSYLVFANAHLRLSGALSQGVRRTASMDRMLNRAKQEAAEAQQREESHRRQQEVREHAKHLESRLEFPEADAFEEVYGEVVSHAG